MRKSCCWRSEEVFDADVERAQKVQTFSYKKPNVTIKILRGTPYWFESADDDEDLELLQAAAKLRGEKDIRTNHEESPVEMKKQI